MEERSMPTVVLETAMFTLVMILSLLGNLMVCYAVRRNPKLRLPSNYYIISLALTDISQALFVMPLSVVFSATSGWPFGVPGCYFEAIVMLSMMKVSLFTMALMALNRYYKIVKPAKYPTVFTKKFIVKTASAVWVTIAALAILAAYIFSVKEDLAFASCTVNFNRFALPILIVDMYLPYFVIGFCYWKIYRVVKMHNANIAWQSANVEQVKITKTLFVTVVSFAILFVPAHTIYTTSLLIPEMPRQLKFLVTLLIFTSSCVNPFIYGFMNRAFKNEFKKILAPSISRAIATVSN